MSASTISKDQSEAINALRFLAVDAVEHASSGHPGEPLAPAEMATQRSGAQSLDAFAGLVPELVGNDYDEGMAEDIPNNFTLHFSVEKNQAKAETKWRGIKRRVERRLDSNIATVAYLFVSRRDGKCAEQAKFRR